MSPEEPQNSKKLENPKSTTIDTPRSTRFAIHTQNRPKRKASALFDEHLSGQPKRRPQKPPTILDRKLRKLQSLSQRHRKLTGKYDIRSIRLETNPEMPEGFYQMPDQEKVEYLDQQISELSRKIRVAEEPNLEQILEDLKT
ncbi:hypothetical protein N7478_000677 [Penicillium angulare]|uniref:uncharacterized protein n=1 Tax=Penicillium angulare TaxID=116970 RepID=UPI0025426058|nr:uncharacterized protein N7478_000677 [Penicillium angulare]KAJ5291426.1 hypothetical protein N7478_000677 [Penicillium angulare]